MSPQEIHLLQNFLDQLVQVQGVNKDPVAQEMINTAVSKQPDASYLLVQRALLLDQAMANANSQIASLQADLREQKALNAALGNGQTSSSSSFLDPAISGWGNSAQSRPLNVPSAPPVASYPAGATSVTGQPLPAYPTAYPANVATPVQYAQPASSSFFGGNTGSVLGSVAATAAGVAAGAFLYEGISHMMNGNEHQRLNANFNDNVTGDNMNSSLSNQNDSGLISGYFDQGQDQSSALDDSSDI